MFSRERAAKDRWLAEDRGPRGVELSGRSENSLGPEGLGCCLALLSSAFNVTERNCESDRDDRQLLTASGEKSHMSAGFIAVCASATHARTHAMEENVKPGLKMKRSGSA